MQGPGLNPCSGIWIPHAVTRSLPVATKDPTCCNQDQRCHILQWIPGAAKYINNFLIPKRINTYKAIPRHIIATLLKNKSITWEWCQPKSGLGSFKLPYSWKKHQNKQKCQNQLFQNWKILEVIQQWNKCLIKKKAMLKKKKYSWQTRNSCQNTFWRQAKEQKHQWPHNSGQ